MRVPEPCGNALAVGGGGAYTDLADFCRRVDPTKLNKRVLEALVLSGALDTLAPDRASLMVQVPEAMKAAEQQARNAETGQTDIFGSTTTAPIEYAYSTAACSTAE